MTPPTPPYVLQSIEGTGEAGWTQRIEFDASPNGEQHVDTDCQQVLWLIWAVITLGGDIILVFNLLDP